MRKILLTGVMGLLLSAPLTSYSYGTMYDDNCCNPCEQQCCCDFTASIDYLYWNVCRSGLDTFIEADSTVVLDPGKVHYIDDNWDSGFRLQLGYNCDESKGLLLRYTHFQTNSDQHIEELEGGATRLHPANEISSNFRVEDVPLNTDAEYSIQFNVLDIEAGSWVSHGCDSRIRPFIGLRFGWIKQDIDVLYFNETAENGTSVNLKQKTDMDSYGVTLGADFRHRLCDCFNIIARIAGGAHYGDFTYSNWQEETIEIDVTPEVDGQIDAFGCDCRAVYSSEVAIGLEYEFCGFCGSELSLALGYELHTWHNLMDFLDFPNFKLPTKVMRDDSSLLLHGLFIRLGASF